MSKSTYSHATVLRTPDLETAAQVLLSNETDLLIYTDLEPLAFTVKDFETPSAGRFQFWFFGRESGELRGALHEALKGFDQTSLTVLSKLEDNVVDWVQHLVALTGESCPFVSLRTIGSHYFDGNEDSVSQCFHRDTAMLSLFRTYYGRGTQYVDHTNVLPGSFNETPLKSIATPLDDFLLDPRSIHEVTLDQVGILKGELNPSSFTFSQKEFLSNFCDPSTLQEFNLGRGLVHRGPPLSHSTEKRLVLTVSCFKAPLLFPSPIKAKNV